ncbi:DUF6069 family protein [Halobacteria archaeon AArc-dxtr1]|nr:DUF6069 family protein [Halobacteria archaeon AArc-dxtr1]
MAAIDTSDAQSLDGRTLLTRGALATVLSVVANWIVLWAALAVDTVEPFDPLSVPPVTLLTVLGALGATLVYGVLTRVSETPDRTFTRLAAVVLVLSFLPDVALLELDPNATVPAVVVLMLMHVVVAVSCVAVLTNVAR